ncbi:MAG TPA: DUF6516 family protein [Allosphingosinicella sp.]
MKAALLLRSRYALDETAFAEVVIWRVPAPVRGSPHEYKYSLALVVDGVCQVRYDNESGKGAHRHVGGTETSCRFTTPARLLADFRRDIDEWRSR